MISFERGNIVNAQAEALVNTVNCVGVMGRGIALQFKESFPANFKAYAAACQAGKVEPGRMFVFDTGELTLPRFIINFPTKRHWRGKSRIEDIRLGLVALVSELQNRGIRSVAIPPLGSGLGGLDWAEVRPLIVAALADLPGIDVRVYEPSRVTSDQRPNRSKGVPKLTGGRAALVGLMRQYLAGLMDPSVSLLEVHKLMYFLQAAHEPLRLRYVKGPYGPYAENLRHVLRAIEGHLISGYTDDGDAPNQGLALVPGAAADAERFLSSHSVTRERFDRVASLVQGFETPFGLELLATVHWVMAHEGATKPEEIERSVYEWSPRKRQFSSQQLRLAVDRLHGEGWVLQASPA